MENHIKEIMDRRLDCLKTDEELKRRILSLTHEKTRGSGCKEGNGMYVKHPPFPLTLPLAACFCLIFSIIVAAAVPQIREKFVHLLDPRYEEFAPEISPESEFEISPGVSPENTAVMKSTASDQGIHISVTNGITDGKTMVLYVNITDTLGRLDDTVSINDYFINGFTYFNSQLIGYDKTTDTARFCLLANGGNLPPNGRIEYQISSLLAGRTVYEDFCTEMIPKDLIQECTSSQMVRCYGGGGNKEMMKLLKVGREAHVLTTNSMNVPFRDDIDFVSITNAGYLDGYLHIQTKWTKSVDNHGDVYLLDKEGKRVPYINLDFEGDNQNQGQSNDKYIEYIYDVSNTDLESCSLYAFFVKDQELIEGNWNMAFSVETAESLSVEVDGKRLAQKAVITPIGIYLYDTQLEGGDIKEIMIQKKDGSSEMVAARMTEHEGNQKHLFLIMESPIDLGNLELIAIDGEILYENIS